MSQLQAEPAASGRVPLWQALAFALLALGLLLHFLGLASLHPFDFIWDMDASATQDALLLNSGHPPAHLDHPKYVMALAQAAEARLLKLGGLVSTASLQDLASSPQPMLALAELNDRLRQVHALLCWLLVLLLSGLLWRLYPRVRWLPLLALPLLGLQAGPIYNALTMRTELYSLLLLGLGLWIPVLLRGAAGRARLAGSLAMGLLWGLALLNKVQSLSLILLLPAFTAYLATLPGFARSEGDSEADTGVDLELDAEALERAGTSGLREAPAEVASGLPSDRLVMALTGLGLGCFALLAGLGLGMPPAPGRVAPVVDLPALLASLPGSLGRFKLQLYWLLFCASGLLAIPLARRLPRGSVWPGLLRQWPWYLLGCLLAFAAPLFALLGHGTLGGLSLGWQYLATLMRTSVWLDAALLAGGNAGGGTLSYLWLHRSDLLLLVLGAVSLLALGLLPELLARFKARLGPTAGQLNELALAGVLAACLLSLLLGNRPLLRDTLWYELTIGWAGLLVLGHLAATGKASAILRLLPPLLVAAAACNSLLLAQRERESLYVFHSAYGGDEVPYDYFLNKSVYLAEPNPYSAIMDRAFAEDIPRIRRAIAQARDWRRISQVVADPLPNTRVPLRLVGLLEAGFPAWRRGLAWARVATIAPTLEGALLVRADALLPNPRSRRYLNALGLDGFQGDLKAPGAPWLNLVPPFHYHLMLALPARDVAARGIVLDPGLPLSIRDGRETIPYQVYRIDSPEVLDQRRLASLSAPALLLYQTRSVEPPLMPLWEPLLSEWLGD